MRLLEFNIAWMLGCGNLHMCNLYQPMPIPLYPPTLFFCSQNCLRVLSHSSRFATWADPTGVFPHGLIITKLTWNTIQCCSGDLSFSRWTRATHVSLPIRIKQPGRVPQVNKTSWVFSIRSYYAKKTVQYMITVKLSNMIMFSLLGSPRHVPEGQARHVKPLLSVRSSTNS